MLVEGEVLDRVFAALADPTRRAILSRLVAGPATVGILAEPFAMTGPAISQHLGVLERAGLVSRQTKAQWRVVSIRPERLDEAAAWVDAHRRDWTDRLDQLESRLRQKSEEQDG